ncbi:MAG: hypothetical protein Fur0016_02020 [Anaerolineales bacterium]
MHGGYNNCSMELLNWITNLFQALKGGQLPEWGFWSYLILAGTVAVEGPIATLLGAGAASAGVMRPWLVFFSAAAGNLGADLTWYSLGYLGKAEWLFSLGRRFGISPARLERMEKAMQKHAAKILFMAKLSVSLVIPALVAAGLMKTPLKKWFPAVFGAEMIWTGALVLIGFYTTEAIKRVERGLEYAILLASALFVVFLFWLVRRTLGKAEEQAETSE